MLNLKFFESFVKTFSGSTGFKGSDAELMSWARTEYKNDAVWAYGYIKHNGGIPPSGGRHASEVVI